MIGRLIDTRRDDRHSHRLLESGLDDHAHDDAGLLVDFLAYPARGLVHFWPDLPLEPSQRDQTGLGSSIVLH
jgi:hypothetical protein